MKGGSFSFLSGGLFTSFFQGKGGSFSLLSISFLLLHHFVITIALAGGLLETGYNNFITFTTFFRLELSHGGARTLCDFLITANQSRVLHFCTEHVG